MPDEKLFNVNKAKIYNAYRPPYPKEFIALLCDKLSVTNKSIIADVGSGTGMLTERFLETGASVYGVEPNDEMRAVAEENLANFNNFTSVKGFDKDTTLPQNSVDFVVAGLAFHFFDRLAFAKECKRILHPDGKVCLIWNNRSYDSEIYKKSSAICRKYCPTYKGMFGDITYNTPEIFEDIFGKNCEYCEFKYDYPMNKDYFVNMFLTFSYTPNEGDENYNAFVGELENLFDEYENNDQILFPFTTFAYCGSLM
ncbi:MAG: class I SAM-dependent methyltransferase [Clostridiales bacterium]|nr:class I SAM-dependent methyltransferase [Clostridiales bacterium]